MISLVSFVIDPSVLLRVCLLHCCGIVIGLVAFVTSLLPLLSSFSSSALPSPFALYSLLSLLALCSFRLCSLLFPHPLLSLLLFFPGTFLKTHLSCRRAPSRLSSWQKQRTTTPRGSPHSALFSATLHPHKLATIRARTTSPAVPRRLMLAASIVPRLWSVCGNSASPRRCGTCQSVWVQRRQHGVQASRTAPV